MAHRKVTAKDVINRISRVPDWWTGGFTGKSQKPGDTFQPNELVRWQATDKGLPEWAYTTVEFKIIPERKRTYLHFRHANWDDKAAMFPHCSIGWAIFLISLKEFVETGKGRPYPYVMPINLWSPPVV